jgi:mannosyltransferase
MPPPEAPANQNDSASVGPGLRPGRAEQSSAGPSSRASGTLQGLSLALLIAACGAFRFVSLAAKPFWFDECFSAEVARIDWQNFLHLLWWREANMSLYYVLLRVWLHLDLHFGHDQFFLRSLSVVFAMATVPAIYWLATLLYGDGWRNAGATKNDDENNGRRIAIIAAALFTFNAYSVRYSQEARSYALFVLMATLSSGFLIAFLRQPTRRNRFGYILASILVVYAHFYALLLLAAHWLVVRWLGVPGAREDSRAEIRAALRRAWIVIAVAVLPLLIFIAKTGAGPIRWIPRPGIADLLRFWVYFTDVSPLVYPAICLAAVLPLGKRFWRRSGSWDVWRCQFLFVWLLFPIVLTVVLSFARPVFLPRYMIFCLPALVILGAAGLNNFRPHALRAGIVGLILLLSARTIPYVYGHDFDDERDAAGAAANFIVDHTQAGDAVVFHIAETRVAYEFFRSERAGENSASPGFTKQLGPEILFPYHGAGLDYHDFTGKPTPEVLRAAAATHPRLWVMLMYNETAARADPTTEMMDRVLPEIFPKMQRWQFHRVEVRLYGK